MLFEQIKNASDLKSFVETGSDSYYFERSTMQFFGDTLRNYGVRKHQHETHGLVYELYRKQPVKHGMRKSAYFGMVDGNVKRLHGLEVAL